MAPTVRKTWLEIFAEELRAIGQEYPEGITQAAADLLAEAEREQQYVEDLVG